MATEPTNEPPGGVTLPSPTIWPLVTALGLTLVAAGLVTNLVLTVAGVAMTIVGLVGWVGQLVSPAGEEQVALVPPERRPRPIEPVKADVARRRAARPRTPLPERVHPYTAGALGGATGGVVMAGTAVVYGLVSGHGIWYPVNLLAGMVLPGMASETIQQVEQFNLVGARARCAAACVDVDRHRADLRGAVADAARLVGRVGGHRGPLAVERRRVSVHRRHQPAPWSGTSTGRGSSPRSSPTDW